MLCLLLLSVSIDSVSIGSINNPIQTEIDAELSNIRAIQAEIDFELMKARSDYPSDLEKTKTLFVLWVDCSDPKLYATIRKDHPDCIHSFISRSGLAGDVQTGIVVGKRYENNQVEQVRAISVGNLSTLNFKEVILNQSSTSSPAALNKTKGNSRPFSTSPTSVQPVGLTNTRYQPSYRLGSILTPAQYAEQCGSTSPT